MDFTKIKIPIKIGRETIYLTSDKYNFILGKFAMQPKKNKKTGEIEDVESLDYSTASYHTTIESALSYLHMMLVKTRKAESLEQLQKNIENTSKKILSTYRFIKKEDLNKLYK